MFFDGRAGEAMLSGTVLHLMGRTALILLDSIRLRIVWTREQIKAVQHENIVFHGFLKHSS
jgi:hypothetical protein